MKRYVIFFLVTFFFIKIGFSATITVRYPNGGQTLYIGDTHTITWDAVNTNNGFIIALLQDDRSIGIIADNVDNEDRSFSWPVGTLVRGTISSGSNFKIKIKEKRVAVSDKSNSNFTITLRQVTSSMQRMEPPEYSLESLTFKNSTGSPLERTGTTYYISYDGRETRGIVVAKLRWNKKKPGSGVNCTPRVEFKLRYLAHRSSDFQPLDTKLARFNDNGECDVQVPFTIRAKENIGCKVNFNARLLPMPNGCDKNHRNNSKGENLQLGLVPDHGPGACDFKIAIRRKDLKVWQLHGQVPKGKAPDSWFFRSEFKIQVKQVNLTRGVPAIPLQNVKCIACFQKRLANGRWHSFPTTSVTLHSVSSLDWTVKKINYRFNTPPNWWDDVRFRVEVDPDKRFNDINPGNNVFYLVFKVQ